MLPELQMDCFDAPDSSLSKNAGTSTSTQPQRDPQFYTEPSPEQGGEHITFLVEGVLFRVARWAFEDDSEVFRDMYALPLASGATPDGASDARPLRLDGVAKCEFRLLLCVMYSNTPDGPDLTPDEWISVLKLADMWHLAHARDIAIAHLTRTLSTQDPVQQLALAQRHGIDAWLLPALNALARRPSPLCARDAAVIGWECALKLAAVREIFPGTSSQCGCVCSSCERAHACGPRRGGRREEYDFTRKIRIVFGLGVAEVPSYYSLGGLGV
ncbi:hypothetical protein BKA93DRAFT_762800 [Sparassis latifolia]